MKVLINYANSKYKRAQSFNTWTAKHVAKFDKVIEFCPNDIDSEFKSRYKEIFSYKRGDGLWLWKPYLINKTLETLEYGDILFYCDSGAFFIRNINNLIDSMGKSDIWVSGLPLVEKQFTKMDTFELMNCMEPSFIETNQISGTFVMIRKSDYSVKIIKEWLNYCCDIRILCPDNFLNLENDDNFVQHREDQSILSLISKKYELSRHKDPSQYGKLPEKYKADGRLFKVEDHNDNYSVILIHHRTSDVNLKVCFNQLLCALLPRRIGLKFINK